MKYLFALIFLFIFGSGLAQESAGDPEKVEMTELKEPVTFKSNDEIFLFTPETKSIRIEKVINKKKIDFGKLRKTTDDGLYIMTSGHTGEVTFGRFDSLGNFKTQRYEPTADTLMESFYERSSEEALPDLKK